MKNLSIEQLNDGSCCACGRDRRGLGIVRGLCFDICYRHALKFVKSGAATWKQLEQQGKARPPLRPRHARRTKAEIQAERIAAMNVIDFQI